MSLYKYNCNKCNFKCKYESIWIKHYNTTLHKTGKRKVRKDKKLIEQCNKCDYKTTSNTNMKMHFLNYHASIKEREEQFKYYCHSCNFGTFSQKIYSTHLKTKKHQRKKLLNIIM